MKRLPAAVIGTVLFALTGFAAADDKDDNAKKIIGKWEVTKSGSDIPNGSTIEFTKDLKLNVVVKEKDMEVKFDGTYKVEKDVLTVKLKAGDQTIDESVTILKLNDKDLELKDKDGKVDVLTKKK